MKLTLLSISFIFISLSAYAQVGINTVNPTSTLDVNGDIRVRGLSEPNITEVIATRIVGMDDEGNFTHITVGDNIKLENNVLTAINKTLSIEDKLFTQTRLSNTIVFPGEPNERPSIIRIKNTSPGGNTEITGIDGGTDGMHLSLYPVDGRLILIPNSTESDPENRIESNSSMEALRYEVMELFYDGSRSKWIIMQSKISD